MCARASGIARHSLTGMCIQFINLRNNHFSVVKKDLPQIEKVIYFSDGCSGQYKNLKNFTIFFCITMHYFRPWDWVNLVSKGGHLVLYIVGKLIPLGFRISILEGLKVSFKRVIALHRRVSVLGTLIFSDNILHKYDQTCYF